MMVILVTLSTLYRIFLLKTVINTTFTSSNHLLIAMQRIVRVSILLISIIVSYCYQLEAYIIGLSYCKGSRLLKMCQV